MNPMSLLIFTLEVPDEIQGKALRQLRKEITDAAIAAGGRVNKIKFERLIFDRREGAVIFDRREGEELNGA